MYIFDFHISFKNEFIIVLYFIVVRTLNTLIAEQITKAQFKSGTSKLLLWLLKKLNVNSIKL